MAKSRPVKVISVTGGKGGVGKTSVTVNLALALSELGHSVMVLDADLGLANIDVMLGLKPERNLSHVIEGSAELADIVIDGPGHIQIVPASSGTQAMSQLSPIEHAGLIRAFSQIGQKIDYLLIDTAAGISDSVVSFTQASQDILFVVCDEPTSITDAYALMKVLSKDYRLRRFRVLANQVRSPAEGRDVFARLTRVTDRFLDVTIDFVGCIPFDENVRKSIKKQRAFLEAFPRTAASMAMRQIAKKVEGWPLPDAPGGHIEFFMERLVQLAAGSDLTEPIS
jgi:flagellar biosynthesis protein FlhG